jgi:hypothetical protein
MYARKNGSIGDVERIAGNKYTVKLFNGPIVHWQAGKKEIELLEFGSFNKDNKNYAPGGKLIKRV